MKVLLPPGARGSPVFSSGLETGSLSTKEGWAGGAGQHRGCHRRAASGPRQGRHKAPLCRQSPAPAPSGWHCGAGAGSPPAQHRRRLFHQRAPPTHLPLGNTDGVSSWAGRDSADSAARTRPRLVLRGCTFCTPTSPQASSPRASRIPVYDGVQKPGEAGLRVGL